MTAPAQTPWSAPPPPPRARWGAGRVIALIVGVLLLLPGLGLVAGGGALLWADWTNRSDGFVVSPEENFSTDGYALVSEQIDLQTDADWVPVADALGTARVDVTSAGTPDVFVGIAPVADANAYLGDVQRTVIRDLGFDTPASGGDQIAGGAPSGAPGDQDFWMASTSGSGTQQLTWEPAEGNWMLVVMNADASAGIQMEARIGAEFPSLGGFGWGLLIGGVLLTGVAVLLIVLAVRTPRDQRRSAPLPGYAVPPPRGPSGTEVWGVPPTPTTAPTVTPAPSVPPPAPESDPGNRGT